MITRDLQELLEPEVQALGFELLAVEMTGRGDASIMRVYIDGPEGITVDDCARVSDRVSALLDVEDPIANRYTLEVSSPGFDRPLRKVDHFAAVIGRRIKLQTTVQISGRRRFSGILTEVTDEEIGLDVDGTAYQVPLDRIMKARLVPEYGANANAFGN